MIKTTDKMKEELAYIRKQRLRGKNRKVRLEQVYDEENLRLAQLKARKGKDNPVHKHKGVRLFDQDQAGMMRKLFLSLQNQTYHASEGHDCLKRCPCGKERLLHKMPFYPDHIVHHALMQVIMPTLHRNLFYDSSASVKKKGISFTVKRMKRLVDENKYNGRLYYAKLDFVKFYQNIRQEKIYQMLCRTFADKGIRYLLREVITTCKQGLGIGLFPIQYLANYYTSPLCREVCDLYDVRVIIYCDDMVVISISKKEVWRAVNHIVRYTHEKMGQEVHGGIGVQVINLRNGLDFVGNVFFFKHTLLRKKMKNKFKKKMHNLANQEKKQKVRSSYKGWTMQCDGYNLWCRVTGMKSFKELSVPKFEKRDADGKRMLEGTKVSASILTDREIIFIDIEDGVRSKFTKHGDVKRSMLVQVEDNGRKFKFFTDNIRLKETLQYIKDNGYFPFRGTLINKNRGAGLPDYEII